MAHPRAKIGEEPPPGIYQLQEVLAVHSVQVVLVHQARHHLQNHLIHHGHPVEYTLMAICVQIYLFSQFSDILCYISG